MHLTVHERHLLALRCIVADRTRIVFHVHGRFHVRAATSRSQGVNLVRRDTIRNVSVHQRALHSCASTVRPLHFESIRLCRTFVRDFHYVAAAATLHISRSFFAKSA